MASGIHVDNANPMVDEVLHITVDGLPANHQVTLTSRLSQESKRVFSIANYTSDEFGVVDLHKTPSTGGLFTGVEPMGLFWSMQPELNQREGVRIVNHNARTSLVTSLDLYDGHYDDLKQLVERRPLANAVVNQWYLSNDVERVEINEDWLMATFFIPKTGGPYPGVIDMFGYFLGKTEHRAALLASKGFATLALQYIHGTPSSFKIITDLNYYKNALEWLLRQPRVIGDLGAVLGVCKGGETGMAMAAICAKVKAVVAINGQSFLSGYGLHYGDQQFPAVEATSETVLRRNGRVWMKGTMQIVSDSEKHRCRIPVENMSASMLLLYGEDDEIIDVKSSEHIIKAMTQHGKGDRCEVVYYPGAGHLIDVPYTGHCGLYFNSAEGSVWMAGGNAKDHAKAQEQMWRRVQEFLKDKLNPRHSKL